jgi:hypothetical protein
MASMGEMHPDLMHPPGFRKATHEGKFSFDPLKAPFHFEPRDASPPR